MQPGYSLSQISTEPLSYIMELISHVHFFPLVSNELDQFATQLTGGSEKYIGQCIAKYMYFNYCK